MNRLQPQLSAGSQRRHRRSSESGLTVHLHMHLSPLIFALVAFGVRGNVSAAFGVRGNFGCVSCFLDVDCSTLGTTTIVVSKDKNDSNQRPWAAEASRSGANAPEWTGCAVSVDSCGLTRSCCCASLRNDVLTRGLRGRVRAARSYYVPAHELARQPGDIPAKLLNFTWGYSDQAA